MANSLKRRPAFLLLFPASLCIGIGAEAQTLDSNNLVNLPPVNVQALPPEHAAQTIVKQDTPATIYVVGPPTIDLLNTGGSANPYRAVSILPSVNAPAIDPYGLANIPGGVKGITVRGEQPQHGASNITFEGLPLTGIDPGPGSQWLFAIENIKAIELSEGPIPPDQASIFTTAGLINSLLRWPEPKAGAEFSQSFGSFNFLRSFARVDSGLLLNSTTSFFASGSWTDADQWRGAGKAANGNTNAAFGVSSQITDALDAKLFFSYAHVDQNTIAPLTYQQVQNLGQYKYYGFSNNPSALNNYYQNNKQIFTDWVLLSELTYKFTETTKLVIKPFYVSEKGNYFDGLANGKIRDWIIDHDWYGLSSELQTRLAETDLKLGYWWVSMGIPGPPSAWKFYTPTVYGGFSGASWNILADPTSRNQFQSVYSMMDKKLGDFRLQFGARYMWENIPGVNVYNTTGLGNISYASALATAPGINGANSVWAHTFGAFLPYMGASYDLTKDLQFKASAGANYGAPAFDAFPAYQQNASAFLAKGITADQLWHSIKPETSANIDVGLRWTYATAGFGKGSIEPTLYYSRSHNKDVVYDPGIGVQYAQNVGESQAYGAELMAHWLPVENLDIFTTVSYDRDVFTANLPVLAGSSATAYANAAVKGSQLPDVPEWTAALGANWRYGDFTVAPILRFISDRYGDTSRTQLLSGYATVDVNFNYELKTPYATFDASLSVTNLFNASYIGFVNNGYYQQSSGTNAFYYPGAPRAIMGKISVKI